MCPGGRDRLSVAGFSLPGYQLRQEGDRLVVSTPRLRVTMHQPLWLEWEHCNAAGEWRPLAADRPTSAYLLNAHGDGVAHYQRRFADERYYGRGESRRSGAHRPPLRDAQLDAMGYNAASTDPLYKHIPFTITRGPEASFGLFYDNLSSCWLDLGNGSTTTTRPIAAIRPKRAIWITTCSSGRRYWTSPRPSCA